MIRGMERKIEGGRRNGVMAEWMDRWARVGGMSRRVLNGTKCLFKHG